MDCGGGTAGDFQRGRVKNSTSKSSEGFPALEPRPNGSAAALEKHCRRNVESFAQFLDVGFVEVTFLVQDFRYDAFRAKDWDQVFLAEIIGIHQRANDFHRGSIRNGMM